MTSKNIPYYASVVVLFFLLKFGFTIADNNDLILLIKPTDKLVGLLFGSCSVYSPESGFYHEKLNILIDKSCSGFNFWILCFLLFAYVSIKNFDKTMQKIICIPLALIGAYLLTIFVNTSRIFASIIVQTHTDLIFNKQQHIIHEAIGIITNLTFLILAYILIEKTLKNKQNNAKLT
jgi:exosortase K